MGRIWSSNRNNEQATADNLDKVKTIPKDRRNWPLSKFLNNDIYGQPELEWFEDGEADIQKRCGECPKILGHDQYIPITKFKITDLPRGYRDNDVYELIKAVADLTVIIKVKSGTTDRQEIVNSNENHDPTDAKVEQIKMWTGSGEIDVYKLICGFGYDGLGNSHGFFTDAKIKREYTTCPCEECQKSNAPSIVWWEIFVYTAARVVHDDDEAQHTTCNLFYDDKCGK